MPLPYRFERGKVGDDLVLQYELTDADIETVTITISDGETLAVDAQSASLPTSRIAQFVWTPTAAGDYLIEWHLTHSGGRDLYTPTVEQPIDDRIAA